MRTGLDGGSRSGSRTKLLSLFTLVQQTPQTKKHSFRMYLLIQYIYIMPFHLPTHLSICWLCTSIHTPPPKKKQKLAGIPTRSGRASRFRSHAPLTCSFEKKPLGLEKRVQSVSKALLSWDSKAFSYQETVGDRCFGIRFERLWTWEHDVIVTPWRS